LKFLLAAFFFRKSSIERRKLAGKYINIYKLESSNINLWKEQHLDIVILKQETF